VRIAPTWRAVNAAGRIAPAPVTLTFGSTGTGHAAAHVKTESGWPAAFAKVKSPDTYLALSSMTGPQVVWFLQFAAAAKAYKALAGRAMPNARWRVYQITAGMPGSTYLLFSSIDSFGHFDAMMAEGLGAEKAMTPAERDFFQKFDTEALISAETNRFRLDPTMSYVPAETKAADPAFWLKK
jgi:hypothetical protein